MKASVDVANLIGPNLVMCQDASKGENKTTAAALVRAMGQTDYVLLHFPLGWSLGH